MHGQTNTPAPLGQTHPARDSQARGLVTGGRNLAAIGAEIATSARMAAAIHMAGSAPTAQNPRDQAARLRDLVASMTAGGGK